MGAIFKNGTPPLAESLSQSEEEEIILELDKPALSDEEEKRLTDDRKRIAVITFQQYCQQEHLLWLKFTALRKS